MKKTLYSYLIKEQAAPLSLCFFGLCLFLVTGRLLQLTQYLFTSSLTFLDLLAIMAFAMPSLVLYALPMSALLGTLLGFLRLNSDNELIALRAAGVSFLQFVPSILSVLLLTTLLSLFNSIALMPYANRAFEVKLQTLGRSILPALLKEGTFIDAVPKVLFFFDGVDPKNMSIRGIFVEDSRQPEVRAVIVADHGQIYFPREGGHLVFKVFDGIITRVSDDYKSAQAIAFKSYDITLNLDAIFGQSSGFRIGRKEMTMGELLDRMQQETEPRDLNFALEFHRRIALPFSTLLLGLIGAPLGGLFRQRGRLAGVTIGLGVFLTYYIMLSAGKGLGENGLLPPSLALWLPNLFMSTMAAYLWLKIQRETPWLSGRVLEMFSTGKDRLHRMRASLKRHKRLS